MRFEDYEDGELLKILQQKIESKYEGTMAVEGGPDDLFMRILARRIGQGRGKDGFGNARAVENVLARVEKNQARRLRGVRAKGAK
ncbi:hypothetical protein CDD82_2748 [Ophiocordyceps australis]|uniref:CbbX AAA lid domain-containing protein n=1 Tax=Ophiocordyceps australis TaxID=1399860 RepID=A0A2C5XDM6_9HYPO|nr:hypothetical protein CDD82_2748 [Ophiocordyceps australis]